MSDHRIEAEWEVQATLQNEVFRGWVEDVSKEIASYLNPEDRQRIKLLIRENPKGVDRELRDQFANESSPVMAAHHLIGFFQLN